MTSLGLLLLTDSRFPAGGYAHSGGLEAAVEDGLTAHEVPGFLAGRLRGASGPEACIAVAAARASRSRDLAALARLDLEAVARCPSAPLRAAATRLGAQLLRTSATVWPDDPVIRAYRESEGPSPRPVAFGVVAAAAALGDAETAQSYLYEDAAMVTTAAVRLLPVDGALAARWLLDTAPEIERLAAIALGAGDDPRLLPGGFAPGLELGSLAHAARQGRLFAS
jgi:urease accessory protein